MKTFKEIREARNYAKEYENYQGKPEQIEKRSSRNKARRLMAKKMNVKGKDVGHKDNDPLNNDPKNLRLEDPSVNRREPSLRDNPVEESVQEFNGPRSRGLLHRKGVKGTSFANKANKTHSQNKTDQQKAAARQKAAAADHSAFRKKYPNIKFDEDKVDELSMSLKNLKKSGINRKDLDKQTKSVKTDLKGLRNRLKKYSKEGVEEKK